MARCRRGEEGAATELVVAFPAFFFLLMVVVQFALWLHASHAAQAAAQEGARVARVASAEAGEDRANRFLTNLAPSLIANAQVTASRDGEVARVDVWGDGVSLIPGFRAFRIHQHSTGPVERFRSEAEG
ncbi:MAG: pilus assembly protein [Actinomycetota bacterium]|nr:pilus assembly protein [Actinomycetota bacterium]